MKNTPTAHHTIELHDVQRYYGSGEGEVRALDGVDLTIEKGEFVAIIGQSGSGKSTLMNILGCLDTATGGSYEIDGEDVSSRDTDGLAALRRRTFGFIFQRYNLLANATVLENVEIPAVYAGMPARERRARAIELLERIGLGNRLDRKPGELSGGQQQRVAIARALMNDPDVILADEPTGALDSQTSTEVMDLLRDLHAQGRTIIVITHDPIVASVADREIVITDGKITKDSGPGDSGTDKAISEGKPQGEAGLAIQVSEAVRTAFRSLRANISRTILTLLGVIIGVSAVVGMLAIGEGSSREVLSRFEAMGSNLVFVNPGAPGTRMRGSAIVTLTLGDAEALAELDNIEAAVPSRTGQATLRYASTDYRTSVEGVSEDWLTARGRSMIFGTFFTEDDVNQRAAVVVLGTTTADNLFSSREEAVGQYVLLGGTPFEVAGIVKPLGASSFGRDQDDIALVPITTGMMRIFGQNYLSSIAIAVKDTSIIDETEAAAEALLLQRHETIDFQLRNTASLLDSIEETQQSFSVLLGSVAAISLLVGGIGVMNIMLVSVSERTREIGVRMATGARHSDILIQFITEALVVGGLGGLLGVFLGMGASLLAARFGMATALTPEPALLAFTSALAVGLVFGYMPARKAARMDPVLALSSE